ncbi:MAG TPA: cell division protein SepF [Candidatus Limosilactobacillus merdigallinarum]|uniref:Cell division protein SepF n=1 Tax=Candidatus Limosilactobacillus merdigallinarum TaxID=2838652 RepID=A0A9D1VIH5_9LACO|nr:cell division protein SepF [Candidatus Limosilactobacillus merdigallinarum]
MMKLFHNFFDNEDTINADYNEESQVPVAANNRKVVSFSRGKALQSNNGKIALFEPRIYGDAREITNRLLEGQAAIINFSQMDPKIALKTVDFLNGAVFAIDGEIKRIGEQIFLCTPRNVEVSGKAAEDMTHDRESENF